MACDLGSKLLGGTRAEGGPLAPRAPKDLAGLCEMVPSGAQWVPCGHRGHSRPSWSHHMGKGKRASSVGPLRAQPDGCTWRGWG